MKEKNTKLSLSCTVFLFLCMLACVVGVTSAKTIYVPNDYAKIQWAVNNASAGDTIVVWDGVYYENIEVDKPLTLRLENGSGNCIVQVTDPDDDGFHVAADHVNIYEFYDPDRTIVKCEWDFGDGSKAEGKVTTHSYNKSGDYTVTLTVTNDEGAKNFTSRIVTVLENQTHLKHIINVDAKVTYVTDLDGDGKNELIVGTYKINGYDYVKLYRYENGYQEIWSYAIPENGKWGGVTAITAGDVDNDGQKEIVVSTGQPSDTGGDRTLRIFKRKSGLDSWEVIYSYKLGERTEALAMAVGDADNDGKNELIVGMSWYARKILQFKYDGSKYIVSTVENTGYDVNSIDIADVDGDGKNEIVAGTSCWGGYDVRVLKWDGSPYKRIKYEEGEFKEIWRTDLATTGDYSHFPEPFIGNLVGSGIPEFVFKVRNPDKTTVKIFDFDKSRGDEFAQVMEIEFNGNFGDLRLFIGDSDNNGVNELIVSGLHDGKLRIYEFVAESGLADSAWPMFRHDEKHTAKSPYTIPDEPALKWAFNIGSPISSSPAIGEDGTIYVGANDGRLYAINPNGTLKWSFETGDKITSSPAVAKDGTIYVGSYDGYVYAINPDGSLKWKFKTISHIPTSIPPVLFT